MSKNARVSMIGLRASIMVSVLYVSSASAVLNADVCADTAPGTQTGSQDFAGIERYLSFPHYQILFSMGDKHNPNFVPEGSTRQLLGRAWKLLLSQSNQKPAPSEAFREKSLLSVPTGSPAGTVFVSHPTGPYGNLKVDESTISGSQVGRDKLVLFHGTNCQAMDSIYKYGIDLQRGNGELSQGFYVTSDYKQAVGWTQVKGSFIRGNENCAAILRIVVKKSKIDEIYAANKFVGFKGIGTLDRPNFFRNFTSANLRLYVLGVAPELPKSEEVDMISGPSIKAEDVFDQYNFLPTESNRSLFAKDSQFISMTFTKLMSGENSTN